jgi:hypothetical protein
MSLHDIVKRQDERFKNEIPKPTLKQALIHVGRAVAESDRRRLVSPTIEAMRVLLEAYTLQPSDSFASQPEHQ